MIKYVTSDYVHTCQSNNTRRRDPHMCFCKCVMPAEIFTVYNILCIYLAFVGAMENSKREITLLD